jgi:hypothetical protein
MRYMVLIYGDETWMDRLSEEERAAHMQRWNEHSAELQAAGVVRDGAALDKTATATTVRRRDGRPLVSDGPFAETREQLAGYYVIEVESRDDAIAWAEKSPAVAHGTVELRPVLEY